MGKFALWADCGNAALDGDALSEMGRILSELGGHLSAHSHQIARAPSPVGGVLYDVKGYTVGRWSFRSDADGAMPPLGDLNLDCMAVEDVEALSRSAVYLRLYAKAKGKAMRARATGKLASAAMYETECERLYTLLPASWRW